MSDTLDVAAELSEIHLQAAISNARTNYAPKLPHTGCCHNCLELVTAPSLFCDKDCSDDYHKRVSRVN